MNFFKTATVSAFVLVLAQGSIARAEETIPSDPPSSRRSTVNVSSAVIPSGFDNTSPVAVVSGLFPNSCYSWDKADVTHTTPTTHEVKSYAQIRSGYCLMVMLPFSEEVPLGSFSSGHHTIRFVNADGSYLEKTLDVE